jgi:glycosyltransferase involved in cell wall biosynthesis
MDICPRLAHARGVTDAPALPILYLINPAVGVTGGLVAVCNAARLLKDDVRIVMVLPRATTLRPEEITGFWRIEQIHLRNLARNPWAILTYLPALLASSWQLKRLMARDGATQLMLNDFYVLHGFVLRLMGFRGRIVCWVRCDPVHMVGPLARPMLALARRAADRMVAVSRHIAQLLPAHYPLSVLYDFYAAPEVVPPRATNPREPRFVYLSNYIEGKGHAMALEAFAQAAAQAPGLRLDFYGGDLGLSKNRDYRAALERQALVLGIAQQVTFHDFLVDPRPMLATACALLNFSRSESFSLTVLEAGGAGVPVIATRSGGPQEIILEGETGFLIAQGDIAAAARHMLTLAEQPERAARMGEAAARHVRTTFAPERFRTQFLSLFDFA